MTEELEHRSDCSDDGMECDVEEITDAQVAALKAAVIANDVPSHLALISAYRRRGDLDEMRAAYTTLGAFSVLTADTWLQWLRDEQAASSDDDASCRAHVQALFDEAVGDWPANVDVWLEFVQWATGLGDVDVTREIFERALTSCGVHVTRGVLLWETYRVYETALMDMIDEGANGAAHGKQRARVDSLYRRQLRLPLMNAEDTFTDYLQFLHVEHLPADVKHEMAAANHALKEWLRFESVLDDAHREDEHLQTYTTYIEHFAGGKQADMARTQMTFERALNAYPTDYRTWQRYTDWCVHKLRVNTLSDAVHRRACRHLPRIPHFWRGSLLAAERNECADADIDGLLTSAYTLYSKPEHGWQLWMEYVGVVRRRSAKAGDDAAATNAAVARTFGWGAQCMQAVHGDRWDDECAYRRKWAEYVAECARDLPLVRTLWTDMMGAGNARLVQSWLDYLRVERQLETNVDVVRKVYYRALNSVSDYPDTMYEALLDFERTRGTLTTLDTAAERIAARRQQVNSMHTARQAKAIKHGEHKQSADRQHKTVEPHKNRKQLREEARKVDGVNDAPPTKPVVAAAPKPAAKRPSAPPVSAESPPKRAKDNDGFAVPSMPKAATPAAKATPSSTPLDSTFTPVVKPAATPTVEPSTTGPVADTDVEKAARTVFVSNLDFTVSAEQIGGMFKLSGAVTDVRLAGLHGKRHKGFAYVEMATVDEAKRALMCDRDTIDNRPMYVSLYKPRDKDAKVDKSAALPFSTGLEESKLFVRGLPLQAKPSDVEDIFKAYAGFRTCRVVTHKSGQSKGMAFVEYATADDAAHARDKCQATVVLGKEISVEISNPPARRSAQHTEQFTPSAQKSRLNLLATIKPRNIHVKTVHLPLKRRPVNTAAATIEVDNRAAGTSFAGGDVVMDESGATPAATPTAVTDTTTQARLSNEQFRQMFLK